eukprot:PhF_6_TR34405/c0_g1_i2/m.50276
MSNRLSAALNNTINPEDQPSDATTPESSTAFTFPSISITSSSDLIPLAHMYPMTSWFALMSMVGSGATFVHWSSPRRVSTGALLALQAVGAWPGCLMTKMVLRPKSMDTLLYRMPVWAIIVVHSFLLWEYNGMTKRVGISWTPMMSGFRVLSSIRNPFQR